MKQAATISIEQTATRTKGQQAAMMSTWNNRFVAQMSGSLSSPLQLLQQLVTLVAHFNTICRYCSKLCSQSHYYVQSTLADSYSCSELGKKIFSAAEFQLPELFEPRAPSQY
jgi:hypothetical protein